MQWRLQGSPPEEVSHASSRVPLAELDPVAAAVALAKCLLEGRHESKCVPVISQASRFGLIRPKFTWYPEGAAAVQGYFQRKEPT